VTISSAAVNLISSSEALDWRRQRMSFPLCTGHDYLWDRIVPALSTPCPHINIITNNL
jgi:hypothetical protein